MTDLTKLDVLVANLKQSIQKTHALAKPSSERDHATYKEAYQQTIKHAQDIWDFAHAALGEAANTVRTKYHGPLKPRKK